MGGKGKKRREKNYRAAHGGGSSTRLPPPPTPSSLDALPSKLRQIMAFSGGVGKASLKRGDGGGNTNTNTNTSSKRLHSEDREAKNAGNQRKDDKSNLNGVEAAESNANQKRNKKRKRKEVKDLRFETAELGVTSSKRKERKKQRLEARKKKHRTSNTDDNMDFPGHEEIKFGEVVEAPPKLVALPKAFKNAHGASKERLRLQAVEAYRKRQGWTSRPGIQLSPLVTESLLIISKK